MEVTYMSINRSMDKDDVEYYSAIKNNKSESVPERWVNLEPILQSEVSQKEKNKYCILTYTYGI